ESLGAQASSLAMARESYRMRRQEAASAAGQSRGRLRQVTERLQSQELAANELRLQLAALADRVREDYGIELAALEHAPADEAQAEVAHREQIEAEISELRRKLSGLGNVNLEALEELDELEARFSRLSEQYVDLCGAKTRLAEIIGRINAD